MDAYRAAPDGPAGEAVAAQARVSLLATAERAESLGALGQAIDALKSAVDVTLEPRDHARLLERVGRLEIMRSRYDEGQATLASAVDAYQALGDQVGVVRAAAYRVEGYVSAAQIASATEVGRSVREAAEALIERDRPHRRCGIDRGRHGGRRVCRGDRTDRVPQQRHGRGDPVVRSRHRTR